MSASYVPNPGAILEPPYDTAFLSQRDLALPVPINFVTAPGVSLTSACFGHLSYEDDSAGVCVSNLLAIGFRRFEIDLFWDQGRSLWTFCPVSIPTSVPHAVPSTLPKPGSSSTSRSALTFAAVPTVKVSARKANSDTSKSSTTSTNATVSTSSSAASPSSTSDGNLVKLGPYSCTTTINLFTLLPQLLDYIEQTETTLDARLLFLIINLHAAASSTSPTLPAPSPTTLPPPSSLLGSVFSANLTAYLYTPSDLRSDQANLNSSWYTVSERYRPTSDYYSTSVNPNGIFSTESGWPSESYVEFSLAKRLLLQWGSIDPQMSDYNFAADDGIIFPQDYIQDNQDDINSSREGVITHGCFFTNNTSGNLSVSNINSSWATVATVPGFNYATASSASLTSTLNLTNNLTSCGISSILNVTLLDSTADENFKPYWEFSYSSSIWSWAVDEPKNYSSETDDNLFNCATTNLDLDGRWTVNDCSEKHYAACRAIGQPYNWTLTSYQMSYSYADDACPDQYMFATPRTALENSYLTQAMRSSRTQVGGNGVWIDFNSLNLKGCWVTGGQNATCPYANVSSNGYAADQTILVPTIAAIIVLVMTALTVFVKIAGHRRVRKRRRRRVNNGFVYEGVPS